MMTFDEDDFTIELDGAVIGRLYSADEFPCLDEHQRPRINEETKELGREIVERYNARESGNVKTGPAA
jgi:hypothetical protein